MTNKAGEQSPAHFLPYLNPLLNPFAVSQLLEEKVKTRYPLRDNGFLWSCYPDLNWGPHPYQGCALPTELQQHVCGLRRSMQKGRRLVAGNSPTIHNRNWLFLFSGDPERARTVDLQRDRLAF